MPAHDRCANFQIPLPESKTHLLVCRYSVPALLSGFVAVVHQYGITCAQAHMGSGGRHDRLHMVNPGNSKTRYSCRNLLRVEQMPRAWGLTPSLRQCQPWRISVVMHKQTLLAGAVMLIWWTVQGLLDKQVWVLLPGNVDEYLYVLCMTSFGHGMQMIAAEQTLVIRCHKPRQECWSTCSSM